MRWFGRRDRDYREELEAHIQIEVQENLTRGMTPREARQAALRTFGNPLTVREILGEARPLHFWQTLYRHIQYSARLMKPSPGLTTAVFLTLAFCIRANAAIFNVLNAVPQPD